VNDASYRLCFRFITGFNFVLVAAEYEVAPAESAESLATTGEAALIWHSSYHICDIEPLELVFLLRLLFD